MFLKLSTGYFNLNNIVAVLPDSVDGTGGHWFRTVDGEEWRVNDPGDMELLRVAIGAPPAPPVAPPPTIDDKVAALVKAVAASYYKAQDRDQTIDLDAENHEPGEDEWPWWQEIRQRVRDITGLELLEMADSMAEQRLTEWRATFCPEPEPTKRRFDLPYGITVCRVPALEPGGKRYAGTIASELYDHLVGPTTGGSEVHELQRAVDAIEGLILAHACEGVDIGAPAYVAGVVTAVEQMANEFT